MNKNLKLSVHQLVDFLLRTGDIDNRVFNKTTMNEGTRIHSFYQTKQGKNYISEYQLFETFDVDDFKISLEGRADGIIVDKNEVTIDEIKSTISPLESFFNEQKEWHLGQAKCYALMYAHEKGLDHVNINLTYIHQLTDERMIKKFTFKTSKLETDINKLLIEYLDFYKLIYNRTIIRNESAKKLTFPFDNFRKGQKKLAKYSYGIAKDGGLLFCEAPTGIGKTISTLYPYAKSFANETNDKIFYLTAKGSGKETAFQTVSIMRKNGLIASDILITAKDKMCYCPGKACNPDECPYAKGYYTKIRKILINSIKAYNEFSREVILGIASKKGICPFELSLDLSLYVDIIICDYNYFFDPMVYLKRYFDEDASKMAVLVDEAHNLVERGRGMYSSSISESLFKKVKRSLKHLEHKKIKNAIKRISKIFSEYSNLENGETIIESLSQTSLNAIEAYLLASIDVSKHHHEFITDEFVSFSHDLVRFNRLLEYFNENFCLYISKSDNDTKICLLCLNPSDFLRKSLDKVRSKVVFSATLSPIDYYINMIGGSGESPVLMLPSPFPKENLCLMIAPKVSIKYKDRNSTYKVVASYIKEFVKGKIGNYFIYVPSYEYLENLKNVLNLDDANLIVQEKDMSEVDKRDFLSLFTDKPKVTTVGLAVVGGAFGEGIDLVSDRLIGVVVVGVGLPQICFEKEKIREFFDKENNKGYNYSYINPGMNKVMQAVGRVIRSESDRGVALLIDERYMNSTYRDLFKNEWNDYIVVTCPEDVNRTVKKFWND
ncbi:MAG: ATP-dependent DNA helicase [Bacilli bacterium]|nr:ATP-dependent DNA helicase [Bacilli bacterium]